MVKLLYYSVKYAGNTQPKITTEAQSLNLQGQILDSILLYVDGVASVHKTNVYNHVKLEFYMIGLRKNLSWTGSWSRDVSWLNQKQPLEVFYKKRCSYRKKLVSQKRCFTGKHLCQSLFNKVTGLRPAILLKKRLLLRCFPVNFVKF